MIGGFGLHPILVTVDTGVIDARIAALVGGVAQSNYSSRLIVNGEGNASDDIDQILSEKLPGMMLVIQGIVGQVLTIKHLAKGGGDEDIRTPDGLDFILTGEQNVTLIYDAVNNEWAFMDGALSVAGANKALSNLTSPTAFNQHLIPNADNSLDIGSGPARMRDVFTHDLRIGSLGAGVAGARQVYGTSSGVRLNTPTGTKFFWDFQNVVAWDMSNQQLSGPNLLLQSVLSFQDTVSHPGANGDIYREGINIKAFSGGAERNLSDIIVGGGASKALDNLVSVSINASLVANADNVLDVGSGANRWRDVFTHDLRLGSSGTGVGGARQVYGTSSGVRFNTPNTLKFFWDVNNIVKFDMSSSSFTGPNIILSDTLTINDSSGDPSANGQLRRNVNDLKVQTGGVVKNFTQMAEKNVINVFTVNQQFDEDIILGSSSIDLVTFNADTVGTIEPSTDNVDDIGNANERYRSVFVHDTVDLLEGFAAGFAPTGSTNRAKLFSRPDGSGKTELRVKFQSGTSILIAVEP